MKRSKEQALQRFDAWAAKPTQRIERFSLTSDRRSLIVIHPQAAEGANVGTVVARLEPWVDGTALVAALNRARVGALDLEGGA